jgi:hypothetical protein
MFGDRHMFPGGNTTTGFFSYYPYILPQDQAQHIFCIKGGPGVGKSTFMKGIGRAMGENGHTVEYMHCSSDPGSLDGLVIPGLKTALIDGTAPHVVDPKNPGAVDEIINLGECWNLPGIKKHKQDIIEANSSVGKLFARVYKYLGAAKPIHDDLIAICCEASEDTAVDVELEKIANFFKDEPKGRKLGRERKLFASAITPDGLLNYLDSILTVCNCVFEVRGPGNLASAFLKAAAGEAVHRGLDVEEYYCPVEPAEKLEHLLIPELSLAFTTANKYHHASVAAENSIDFEPYMNKRVLEKYSKEVQFDKEQFDLLLREAVETLKEAKAMHDYMETFYVPNMDFGAISQRRNELIERILVC